MERRKRNFPKRALAAVFALFLASWVGWLVGGGFQVEAAELEYGDFAVAGNTDEVTYQDNILTISGGEITVAMKSGVSSTSSDRIEISDAATVTLDNLNIDLSSMDGAPVSVTAEDESDTVTILLKGSSTLTAGGKYAGLEKDDSTSKLVVDLAEGELKGTESAPNLTVTGGYESYKGGAGIGGGNACSSGNITLQGGYIVAQGGATTDGDYGGAGIGGGYKGSGSGITISGENTEVIATGGLFAAGIGGGKGVYNNQEESTDNLSKDITICDGAAVTAVGGEGAAGIGGGYKGSGSGITISGKNTKVIASGGRYGAGIGGGDFGDGTDITIDSGATVTAMGGEYAAGIGGANKGEGAHITISGENTKVEATGGEHGAGIGGGDCGKGSGITIDGGAAVIAVNADTAAGIGGGYTGSGSDITISGENTKVEATGGEGAAGIGGGRFGNGSDITIDSGVTVTATSGSASVSGVGSGSRGNGSDGIASNIKVGADMGYYADASAYVAGTSLLTALSEETDVTENIAGKQYFYAKKHIYNWEYTADEDSATITAECADCGTQAAVTLTAPDGNLTYDGTAKEATIGSTDDKWQKYFTNLPDISYSRKEGDGTYKEISGAPTEVGNYQASITVSTGSYTGTVSKTFAIVAEPTEPTTEEETNTEPTTREEVKTEPATEEPATETKKPAAEPTASISEISLKGVLKGKKARLTWTKAKGADGYDIFSARCGKKLKKIKTVSAKKKTWTSGKKSSGNYKYIVKAFTETGGKKHYIAKSNTVHLAFSKKYTNVKIVKAPKTVRVKKGRKKKLSVKLSLARSGRKITKHMKILRYKSSDKKVASVTKNGFIKAKKKESCTITVTAQSGAATKVKVVVK